MDAALRPTVRSPMPGWILRPSAATSFSWRCGNVTGNALDGDERARAIDAGQAVYARYGDAVAKPRIAAQLSRGRSQTTGSRTGFVGNLSISVPGPGNTSLSIDPEVYYAAQFWNPRKYQQWQDAMWRDPRIGRVTVGEVEAVDDPEASDPEMQSPPP
jgi:uncharacterized protein